MYLRLLQCEVLEFLKKIELYMKLFKTAIEEDY